MPQGLPICSASSPGSEANAEEGGSVGGAVHRGWVNLKSAVAGRTDVAILEECERGEDVAKARYGKALEATLPEDIRRVVKRQYDGVISNHDQIRDLRDRYRASTSPLRGRMDASGATASEVVHRLERQSAQQARGRERQHPRDHDPSWRPHWECRYPPPSAHHRGHVIEHLTGST